MREISTGAARSAHAAESSRRVIRESLAAVRKQLLMEVAFVGMFDGGRRRFDYVDAEPDFCPVRPGESDPLEDSYCGWIATGRLPELIADTAQVPMTRRFAATAELPVGAHLSVPLRGSDDNILGTLCCFSRQPDPTLRERDLQVLRLFSGVISRELECVAAHEDAIGRVGLLISELLDGGGPTIATQPIVDLGDGSVYGYEALARFPDVVGWSPARWFAEAAAAGLSTALQASSVRNAISVLPDLPADATLWVNVSPSLIGDIEVHAMLTGAHASRLVVELAEHDPIDSYDDLAADLGRIRASGAKIAIDDAGSGYAGLQHILGLRPEIVKLDRALIVGIGNDPARQAMVTAMVGFGAQVGSIVVAEGIETEHELRTLQSLGVSHGQGYYLGRPQGPDERTNTTRRGTLPAPIH
jgi:EAL domain-containing protein (putative c-di-GMP-specific phosphodiesterase class I)